MTDYFDWLSYEKYLKDCNESKPVNPFFVVDGEYQLHSFEIEE